MTRWECYEKILTSFVSMMAVSILSEVSFELG